MDLISSLLVGLAQVLCESMNMAERRGHASDVKQAISDLEAATGELKAIRDDLNLRIQQDKLEGRSCTNRASEWLRAVHSAETKTDLILASFVRREQRTRMRRCLPCGDYKLRNKILATLKSVNELRERSDDIKTDGWSIQTTCREMMPIKSVVGITTMVEKVWEALNEEGNGIIGLYGPGGVGKTTLMQSINNELITKGHQYDVLVWVTVSRAFGECTIQQAVGAHLGLCWEEKETGEHRAAKIYRALKQKRFLLLLDDVWEELDLEKTGVPLPDMDNKCKVVFTTRSMALCSSMGAECKLRVEFLGQQDAWGLFCDKVGRRDLLESPWIRRHAEVITSNLKQIGDKWRGPIHLYIANDLFQFPMWDLIPNKTHVKMHNVVRSFALWMASEQGTYKEVILVEPRMGLTEAPKANRWRHALVVSLMDNRIETLPEKPVCLNLKTLMLQQNSSLKKIPTGFFPHMPTLRVLDLSFTSISEIPLSIKYLVELYYLAMSGTKISVLPKELGNLRKLKHLDLQRTQFLQTIPRDAICWLSKLEVLNLYYSYAGWELQSFGEDEELRFADLEHLENLTTLGITLLSLETLKTLYEFRGLHKRIQHLHIEECNGLLNFKIPSLRSLRRLSIKRCSDLEYLVTPTDVENGWLPSLEVMTLHSLPKLSSVWRDPIISQECLRNIQCINIAHCHKLKNVSWVSELPKLEMIDLFDCRELEEVISEHESPSIEEETTLFPGLKTLKIRDLPDLKSILPCRFSFQKLQTLSYHQLPPAAI